MAKIFFIDESGIDHKNMPYEIRGGFSIHVSKLWSFVQNIPELEGKCFGQRFVEIKVSKQLDKKRFKWSWRIRNLTSSRLTALNRFRRAVVFPLINN